MTEARGGLTAALADRYRIERELGQGGMATVYLARDLKHDRDVALKVLRPELGAVLGTERFLAEIKITARLDHPHILTLIDSGVSDGFLYYVLPLVRGESLRDRLEREKQLGLDEALAITKQVAGALDYAHRQGVIHRDIKPENILIQEGEAMLADFGIALAVKQAGGHRLTETGLSLGTPQYMSPEQATGDRTLDARTDVYSLAAVLYEMLAGEPPVTGPNAQAMIAKLMTERPTRLRVVRDTVPEAVDGAVARALAKTPADRFAGAAEFARALVVAVPDRPGGVPVAHRPQRAIGALFTVVVLGALAFLAWGLLRRTAPTLVLGRSEQLTAEPGLEIQPAIAPDGKLVAYAGGTTARMRIFIRPVGRLVATDDDLHSCAWSPNGRWIACAILNAESVRPGSGFGNIAPSAILLFPAAGGEATRLIEPSAFNQSPVWAPDGSRLLFLSNRDGPRDVYAVTLTASGRPAGEPARLTTGLGPISISLSADGARLAYAVYSARANIWSLPIPAGAPVGIAAATPVTSGSQVIESMRVSRDGRWLLYDSDLRGNADVYRIPTNGGQPEQLTSDPADEFAPDLSPDGRAVAYHSWRTGTRDVEVKPLDGGPVVRVTATPAQESYPVWSPDGHALVFYDQVPPAALYLARRAADGRWSAPVRLATPAINADWSPDGRWIAYVQGEIHSRAGPVMVLPAEGGDARRVFDPTAAAPAAINVQWSPDGRTLYYKSHDEQGRASFWGVSAAGGRPRLLVRLSDPDRQSSRRDFATDGRRFYFAIEDRQSDVFVAELIPR